MIKISLKSEFFSYDAFHIVKAFFPMEEIKRLVDEGQAAIIILDMPDQTSMKFWKREEWPTQGNKLQKHYINIELYKYLAAYTGNQLEWGILTGIRPTKIAMKELELGKSKEEVIAWLQEYYLVSKEKSRLGVEIAVREMQILGTLDYKLGYSLYVGIPFCPTRCTYCSFTSYPIQLWKKRVDEYLHVLHKEITAVGAASKNKRLNTIYIGGGTPTTLEAAQLDRLLTHLEDTFSFEYLKEITVEAGRPDSITREKLEVLRKHSITRISINPQTMQQKTLEIIGRNHSVLEVERTYTMARELGFDNINMDLILGLPGETAEDVKDTLEQIKILRPDSLTVHSLAMKRASVMARKLREEKEQGCRNGVGETESQMPYMIALASEYAEEMGLKPYYLYRQKNMAGNFENVGYAKADKTGIYNILIMEEKQSIVAVGAGASTKIVLPREKDNIVRLENVKDIDLYISRIDEMIERRGEWLWH